jgi:hypothetical protein
MDFWLGLYNFTQNNAVLSAVNVNFPKGLQDTLQENISRRREKSSQNVGIFSCNWILCDRIVTTDISPLTQPVVKPRQWDAPNWLRNTGLNMFIFLAVLISRKDR